MSESVGRVQTSWKTSHTHTAAQTTRVCLSAHKLFIKVSLCFSRQVFPFTLSVTGNSEVSKVAGVLLGGINKSDSGDDNTPLLSGGVKKNKKKQNKERVDKQS